MPRISRYLPRLLSIYVRRARTRSTRQHRFVRAMSWATSRSRQDARTSITRVHKSTPTRSVFVSPSAQSSFPGSFEYWAPNGVCIKCALRRLKVSHTIVVSRTAQNPARTLSAQSHKSALAARLCERARARARDLIVCNIGSESNISRRRTARLWKLARTIYIYI